MTVPVTSNPRSNYGTLAESGIGFSIDPLTGEIQQVPYTGTSPFGEPPLLESPQIDPSIPPEAHANFRPHEDEIFLHDQIHGTPWHGYYIQAWVNPDNPGIPNLGPVNEQPFQSAHTNAIVHNPSAEQGWGMDPAIVLPRYPHVQNTFPQYARGTRRRMGDLEWEPEWMPFWDVTQQNVALQQGAQHRASSLHGMLSDIPPAVPYSSTVPVYGNAGPLDILPEAVDAIY